MRQQRAFQGAARVVAVVDELMRTILGWCSSHGDPARQLARVSNLLRTQTAATQIARTQRPAARDAERAVDRPPAQQRQRRPRRRRRSCSNCRRPSSSAGFATNLNRAKNHLGAVDSTLGDLSDLLQQAQTDRLGQRRLRRHPRPARRRRRRSSSPSTARPSRSRTGSSKGIYLFAGDRSTDAPFVSEAGGVRFVGSERVLRKRLRRGHRPAVHGQRRRRLRRALHPRAGRRRPLAAITAADAARPT